MMKMLVYVCVKRTGNDEDACVCVCDENRQ